MWQKLNRNKPKSGGRHGIFYTSKSRKEQSCALGLTFLLPEITDTSLHCCCPVLPSSPHFSSMFSSSLFFAFHAVNPAPPLSVISPCCCSHISCLIPHLGFFSSCQAHPHHKPEKNLFLWKPLQLQGQEGLEMTPLPAPASMCSPAGNSASSSTDPNPDPRHPRVAGGVGRELTFF